MPKLVCPTCRIELRPETNGVDAIEMASFGESSITMADLWQCPDCGHQVLAAFAAEPHIHHYEADFRDVLDRIEAHPDATVVRYWVNTHERDVAICEKLSAEAEP